MDGLNIWQQWQHTIWGHKTLGPRRILNGIQTIQWEKKGTFLHSIIPKKSGVSLTLLFRTGSKKHREKTPWMYIHVSKSSFLLDINFLLFSTCAPVRWWTSSSEKTTEDRSTWRGSCQRAFVGCFTRGPSRELSERVWYHFVLRWFPQILGQRLNTL